MKIDKRLYKTFLEEMDALDNFRMAYASLRPGVSLDQEDPDVRRLIEAMAIFTARTRLAGTREINARHRQILLQYFPFLLTPLPAMAMAQAVPTGQLAEAVFFPKGSEFVIAPESGGSAFFRTLRDLRILPVLITNLKLLQRDNGVRIALRIRAAFKREDTIGGLNFFINHLNNYDASQLVLFQLKHHLQQVSVVFDKKVDETTRGLPCSVSFGMPQEAGMDAMHPLEKERRFFHFPWQELFLNVQVPQPPGSWQKFTLCFDVDDQWPRNLMLDHEVFQPFAVPLENLRKAPAQPLSYDGTRESSAIVNPDIEYGFKLQSIQGVYEVTSEGMTPVKPGIISGTAPSYETEEVTDNQGRKHHRLNLHFPQAFETPKTIVAEAHWHQPWFSETIAQRLSVLPFSRSVVSLKWELPIEITPHAEPYFQDSIEGFLHFITLTNQATLGHEDLLDVIRPLGILRHPSYQQIGELLSAVRIEKTAQQRHGATGLLLHRYVLQFDEHDATLDPLMEPFLEHLETILDTWISGAKIEVRKETT